MEAITRHFWIVLVLATVANGRSWWNGVQSRIQSNPDLEPGYRRLYLGYLFWMNVPWLAMGLGIVSGHVSTLFDFLRPSEGNAFVAAWWGLMAALLGLASYWMLFGGGAEMLERYPGVFMVPRWSASKLRILWLGVVAWNLATGAMLFFRLPESARAPAELPSASSWLRVLFPVLFVAGWLLVSVLLSAMGGWRALAQQYAAGERFSGKRFHFRSAQLGGFVNYSACLTLGASAQGLYLAVLPLFRMGHPPLIIPWADVTAREARSWLFSAIELESNKVPGTTVRLSARLAQALFDASGTQVLVQPPA